MGRISRRSLLKLSGAATVASTTGGLAAILASGRAGFAISYGLGQGATMIAAFWGVFIWKEFRHAPAGTSKLLAAMFACFLAGLALLVLART